VIELHAQFLELNFLSQIRALPNPSFIAASESQRQPPHPLTLHLSPTTTANIIVTSVNPVPPQASPFVKISPDAEVIVAPKTRQKAERSSGRESRSVGGTSRRSTGGKSTASTVRRRSGRDETSSRGAIFLRGVDRGLGGEWFDDDETIVNEGLTVWVDRDMLLARALRGVTWVSVSIVKPAGLQEPTDPQKEQETEKPATKVIAHIGAWEDAPDSRHVALSTDLCKVLGSEGLVGGLVRIECAPSQVSKPSSMVKPPGSRDFGVKSLKIVPFSAATSQLSSVLKFGGESKQEREAAAQRIKVMYGKTPQGNGLLDGPVTDGMILPAPEKSEKDWQGGIVKFEPTQQQPGDGSKLPPAWFLGSERKISIEVQPDIPKSSGALKGWPAGESLPKKEPKMVGIDPLIEQLTSHLSHHSSVLLTGGLGAGKTTLTHLLVHHLRSKFLFNVVYFPCRKLVNDETRVSTIKETLNRLFTAASWGARLGGRAVVVLDDLDRLCPVETELQVGGENGRSRHISESICSIVRQYCSMDSGVVLLATAQSKEALNNVIIGGHLVREIVSLKAPNKEGRRRVLEMLVHQDAKPAELQGQQNGIPSDTQSFLGSSTSGSRPSTSHTSHTSHQRESQPDGFVVDPSIDFLDLAGMTDGYMPGDLVLLVSRARSEALIRSVSTSTQHLHSHVSNTSTIHLSKDDFTRALSGFTPASLRNVTLQSSTTRWDSVGGLHSTRQTLLETLQYPTAYAPIFAQCPLRLRSGLLLYGYPGCGKTLLASAVAGECGLNFISVKGPEILNKYIGASEKSVRDLFERAEAARPCVLFFDEFDSIAPKRGHDSTGVTDRVVNQLLTQMDGAEGLSGVYVLAATSRPDLIDPALLRPGRLDKSLICDLPGLEERIDILKAVTRKLKLAYNVLSTDSHGENLREIAQRTEGYSGADLQAVVYNAQLEAIHDALGDVQDIGEIGQGKGVNGSNNTAKSWGAPKGAPDFVHFRFGDSLTPSDENQTPTSAELTERATIAAKLASLQSIRRKQKLLQYQSHQPQDADTSNDKEDSAENKEPEIQWRHIKSSLATTRSSISPEERRRLAGIYKEFVVGRNGELPSGQGGSEIGGRTSLM
jgi:peroxin-1